MKISYRTHPALNYLESDSLYRMEIREEDLIKFQPYKEIISSLWKMRVHHFKSEIKCISESFYQSYIDNAKKITPEIRDFVKENFTRKTVSGTMLLPKSIVLCYYLNNCTSFDEDNYTEASFYLFKEKVLIQWFSYSKQNEKWNEFSAGEGNPVLALMDLTAFLTFIKYCPIETKYLKANSRLKDINCKYVNETNSNIKVLDSTWFTNLVKSDAFKVRGHFRLQPKKVNGEWTKELIWINEFQKHGYTAPAKKLKEYPEVE